ncbi:hypothetical protein IHE61_16455 [Streptomyces sp. GKU 257-1]|nr:hypothetical protein [Streptomyces sp. GKU 257-1]
MCCGAAPRCCFRSTRGDGAARDFLVVGANHLELSGVERDPPTDLLGRPLSQTRPGIRAGGMYDVYRRALEGRGPATADDLDYVDLVDGGLQRGRLRGTVVLLPDEGLLLLLTNWEPVGDVRLSHRIQERSRLGWAEWDLVSGRMRWSHGLRRLLGLPTARPRPRPSRSTVWTARPARLPRSTT